jgi:hypothetical protein
MVPAGGDCDVTTENVWQSRAQARDRWDGHDHPEPGPLEIEARSANGTLSRLLGGPFVDEDVDAVTHGARLDQP